MKNLEVFTDGGCRPNPGKGACAFVVIEDGHKQIHQGVMKQDDTTNNIMELSGVINALKWVKEHHISCRIYLNTDSQYVQLGITKWLLNWKRNNWRNAQGKPVANKELWQELATLTNQVEVHFQWVKGHSNNRWNNLADKLCTEAMGE